MRVSFSNLPRHLQLRSLNKLMFCDFLNFRKSSRSAAAVSEHVTAKLPFDVSDWSVFSAEENVMSPGQFADYNDFVVSQELLAYPIKMECYETEIRGPLTDELCSFLLLFIESIVTTEIIEFHQPVVCSPELFNRLVKKMEREWLVNRWGETNPVRNAAFLRQPDVRKMKCLIGFPASIEDEDLRHIVAKRLVITRTNLTSNAFNAVLKQWKNKERRIKKWEVDGHFPPEEDTSILLDGLQFAVDSVSYRDKVHTRCYSILLSDKAESHKEEEEYSETGEGGDGVTETEEEESDITEYELKGDELLIMVGDSHIMLIDKYLDDQEENERFLYELEEDLDPHRRDNFEDFYDYRNYPIERDMDDFDLD